MNIDSNILLDSRYQKLPVDVLPFTEVTNKITQWLKDTVERVLPYWYDSIASDIISGKNVIVVAHGNSIRAIAHFLSSYWNKNFPQ